MKICGILLIANMIISCSNDENNSDTNQSKDNIDATAIDNNAKKEPVCASIAEKYEFNNEDSYLNIERLILSNQIDCLANEKLCPEILQFIGTNKLVFSSNENEDLSANINLPDYEIAKKGEIQIANDEYPADLYYNYTENIGESRVEFNGILVVSSIPIKSLPNKELIILTKGIIQ